jgi:hypothetical protein
MNRKEITRELLQMENLYDKWLENAKTLDSDGRFFEEVFYLPLQSEFDIKHLYKYFNKGELLISKKELWPLMHKLPIVTESYSVVNGEGNFEERIGRHVIWVERLHLSNCNFDKLFLSSNKYVIDLLLGDSNLRIHKFDMIKSSCVLGYNSNLTIENETTDIEDNLVMKYSINGRRYFPNTLSISSKVPVMSKLKLNIRIEGDNNTVKIDLRNFKNMSVVISFSTTAVGNEVEIIGANEKNLVVIEKETSLKNNTLIER